MFRDIQKITKYSLLNGTRLYKTTGPSLEVPGQEAESPTAKSLDELRKKTDSLVYQHEGKFIRLLSQSESYEQGDYEKLNKQFIAEFAKEGVNEAAAKRLLEKFQNEVFDNLGLRGDRWAVADRKLGAYSLWAFSIYFGLKRPKFDMPAGSKKLEAKVEKETGKAYRNYKKVFGEESPAGQAYYRFRDLFTKIQRSVAHFNGKIAGVGKWLLAAFRAKLPERELADMGMPKVKEINIAEKGAKPYLQSMFCKTMIGPNEFYMDEKGDMYADRGAKLVKQEPATLAEAAQPLPASEEPKQVAPQKTLRGVPESLAAKIPKKSSLYKRILEEGLTFRRVYFERIKGNRPNKENPQYFMTSDGRIWDKKGEEIKDAMVVQGALIAGKVLAVESKD